MRTTEFNGHTITCPDEICFAFNPQIITVDKLTKSVVIRVGIYSDKREPINGKVSIDISEYIRSMLRFESTSILETKHNVHIEIDIDEETYYIFLYVIWGAMNIGELFNPSRTVTMFRKFPSHITLFSYGEINVRYDGEDYTSMKIERDYLFHKDLSEEFKDAKEFGMIKILNTPEAPSTFQFTFDRTFKPIPKDAVYIKVLFNDCDKGIYLRWLDRHGFLQYWLFQEGDLTGKSSNQGELLNVEYRDERYDYYGMSRYQGKAYQMTLKACAPLVDKDTFKMLSTLHSSPIVDMYIDEKWIPVNIVAGSFIYSGADLQDFEIQITMPETITQII